LKYLTEFNSKSKLPSRSKSAFTDFQTFSTEKIETIRSLLKKRLQAIQCEGDCCVVAVGSYGRYEASAQSDLDVYVIYSKKMSADTEEDINEIIQDTAKNAGAKCSVGFESISIDAMYKNIGGKEDTNPSITNRILFLLESECLYNEPFFNDAYKKILKKYLKDIIKYDNKPPRFLLSDIIRYYRTICVDYEFKTTEDNKEWAIRNIKLRFSRKGLYFGGIVILLNSLNKHNSTRYDYIIENLRLPFADKISHILLEQKMTDTYENILVLYADFLREIGRKSVRNHLDNLKKVDREKDKVFHNLTEMSRQFNADLLGLLNDCKWGDKNYLDFLVL
jgi:predicted nucleotidyltransferase